MMLAMIASLLLAADKVRASALGDALTVRVWRMLTCQGGGVAGRPARAIMGSMANLLTRFNPTRPEGRVLRSAECHQCRLSRCFNPHPAFGPGATTRRTAMDNLVLNVSILTLPEGRVLLQSY